MNPIHVRKIGPWWLWYCQVPGCGDFSTAYYASGPCADAGRAHHSLWHCDGLPPTTSPSWRADGAPHA